jgi:hypothetical protein
MDTASCKSRDLLSSPWSTLLVFCLPAVAIVATGRAGFETKWRTIVWTIALGTRGIGCTVNALRCGRLHCYATGPFFLLMALVTILYSVNVVPLGRNGWGLIGLTVLVGAVVFCCIPEMLWGKYRAKIPPT